MPEENENFPKQINSTEKKELKKANWFIRTWRDPVGSKLIASGIIFLVTVIYGIISSFINDRSIWDVLIDLFRINIPIYIFLIVLVVSLFIFWLINWIISNKKIDKYDFILKQMIGDVSFSEFYNMLLSHHVKTPISLSRNTIKEIDLLTCFSMYVRLFATGVRWDHPGDQGKFLYYTVGPILIGYGILKKEKETSDRDHLKNDIICISELGVTFYRWLNLSRMYNKNEMHEW